MTVFAPLGGCPFPTISVEGVLRDGVVLGQPDMCKKCLVRPCKRALSEHGLVQIQPGLRAGTCSRGADYAVVDVDNESLAINGLLIQGLGNDKARRLKRELQDQRVTTKQLVNWRGSQLEAIEQRNRDVLEKTRQSLEMFHDVQTAASSIIRSAERLQASQPGRDDDEKFAALPPAAQTLVKAAGLLELRLRTMPIVTNPDAATYGNKIKKPVYRIIDMLVRTLQPLAQKKGAALVLRGTSHKRIAVYESFDLLPLTLIENAIKYSAPGQRVEVQVDDTDYGVSVSVSSFSPWIEPEERSRIFERRFRSSTAASVNAEGSGLGLFIAETVATAHSTHVLHWCDDGEARIAGVRFCNNRFFFSVRG